MVTFCEHLNVQPEYGEPPNQHHQLQPHQEYDDGRHMMLPYRYRVEIAQRQCARCLFGKEIGCLPSIICTRGLLKVTGLNLRVFFYYSVCQFS